MITEILDNATLASRIPGLAHGPTVGYEVDVERVPDFWLDRGLNLVLDRIGKAPFDDDSKPRKNTTAMRVNGENFSSHRVHEDASSRFQADSGQRGKKVLRAAIVHISERGQSYFSGFLLQEIPMVIDF